MSTTLTCIFWTSYFSYKLSKVTFFSWWKRRNPARVKSQQLNLLFCSNIYKIFSCRKDWLTYSVVRRSRRCSHKYSSFQTQHILNLSCTRYFDWINTKFFFNFSKKKCLSSNLTGVFRSIRAVLSPCLSP